MEEYMAEKYFFLFLYLDAYFCLQDSHCIILGAMMSKERPFFGPGIALDGNVIEPTGFVRATTDTAFKIMMPDDRVAMALIGDIFRDMKVMDMSTTIQIIDKGETKILLQGKRSNAIMDYHTIIGNRGHVIIEMQIIRHDNFDKRSLFYEALTFSNQEFEGGANDTPKLRTFTRSNSSIIPH
jgi:hypothetical protein